MRTFAKWLVLLVLSLVALVVLALLIMPSNIVELEFATYEQAISPGAINRQALPDYLPKSAKDIHSTQDLDNGDEMVTFRYGSDFDRFIAAQVAAPPRTAKSLGIRLWDDDFTDPNELSYFPEVALYREHKTGERLINRVQRTALYID
jgi:hypothetical protein